jgi:hypothetical protein
VATSSLRPHSVVQGLGFLVGWNLANTLPWLAAGAVYRTFLPIGALAWMLACLGVGVAQWLVLQRYISGIGQWPLATFVGGIIGYAGFAGFFLGIFLVPLLTGIAVGVGQWMVLKHKLTAAFWWIVATTAGAIVGLVVGYLTASLIPTYDYNGGIENTVFVIGIGVEIGSSLITGCAMLRLLKRNANRKAVLASEP